MENTERFVDQCEKPIAPQNTWAEMSLNALIETRNQIDDKYYSFQHNPSLSKVLLESRKKITSLIEARMASSPF